LEVDEVKRVTWIGEPNELIAAYSADGYARVNGYGAVCTTYMVGELSAINGVAGSFAHSLPVFHLVGTPDSDKLSNPMNHHTMGHDQGSPHAARDYNIYYCYCLFTSSGVELTHYRPYVRTFRYKSNIVDPNMETLLYPSEMYTLIGISGFSEDDRCMLYIDIYEMNYRLDR